MDKLYLTYDQDGYYIEPIVLDHTAKIPENATEETFVEILCPRWDGTRWTEAAPPPPEMDPAGQILSWNNNARLWTVTPKPYQPPTETEVLRTQLAAMAASNEFLEDCIIELAGVLYA